MSTDPGPPGYELPLRLLMAFRMAIDEVHGELARRGHPDAKPMYGFVFQAIGPNGSTAVELGRALGISKQAAGKTIDVLERLGYIERARDDVDSRRKVVRLTPYGLDLLAQSAQIFDAVRRDWSERIGSQRLAQVEDAMRELTGAVDLPAGRAWLVRRWVIGLSRARPVLRRLSRRALVRPVRVPVPCRCRCR